MLFREMRDGDLSQVRYLLSFFSNSKSTDDEIKAKLSKLTSKKYYVIEYQGAIIAACALFSEYKIHHSPFHCLHIEDVVVKEEFRGRGVGKYLMKQLLNMVDNDQNVYKIVLQCSEENLGFYESYGFSRDSISMVRKVSHEPKQKPEIVLQMAEGSSNS